MYKKKFDRQQLKKEKNTDFSYKSEVISNCYFKPLQSN